MKPTEDKEAMLTEKEISECIKKGYAAGEFDIDMAIDRRIALAALAKLDRLGYERKS